MIKKSKEIKVSILCLAYNHEKYLEKCLDSLVNQKTNFKYEILVHDDCSTDSSKEIIERYYKKHPKKIIPVYEKENQYSKGVKINKDILIPKMKGKYFCFCEGDDYWIDENKLQKQYDFMERNKDYKLCIHNSIAVDKNGNELYKINPLVNGGDLKCEDFIKNGGGFVSTNSLFSYSYLAKNLPNYFDYLTVDYVWQIYLSSIGKNYCFKEHMSAYRIESEGSWTSRMLSNIDKLIEFKRRIINVLTLINDEMHFKYDEIIKKTIISQEFAILELQKDYKSMKKNKYKEVYKSRPLKIKMKYFLDEHFPSFYNFLRRLRSKK